jgi:hypothetical protein
MNIELIHSVKRSWGFGFLATLVSSTCPVSGLSGLGLGGWDLRGGVWSLGFGVWGSGLGRGVRTGCK